MSKNSALASINLRLAGVDVQVVGSAEALMAVGMDVSTQYQLMRHGSKEAREAISACGDLLVTTLELVGVVQTCVGRPVTDQAVFSIR